MKFHLSIPDAIEQLERENPYRFTTLMKHGSMSIEYYAPKEVDAQTPHTQDEIYVIASGTATFFRNGERVSCKMGDLLFVPAGMEHYFEEFSSDFGTWVIFFGKEGGEDS